MPTPLLTEGAPSSWVPQHHRRYPPPCGNSPRRPRCLSPARTSRPARLWLSRASPPIIGTVASASPAGSRPTSSATATVSCSTNPPTSALRRSASSQPSSHPRAGRAARPLHQLLPQGAHQHYPRATTTRKAGTTSISSAGWATPCRLRSTSSAATLSSQPSLPRPGALSDLAARAGRYGTQRFLSFFLKSPMHDYTIDEVPVNHLFQQYVMLKNAIREMGGYKGRRTNRLNKSTSYTQTL